MSNDVSSQPDFCELGLIKPVLKALDKMGYETPTPVQVQAIPHVLAGRDLLGQAQTGTGKTAAFALPLLSRIDLKKLEPQVLVLAPTRELAIQVAESFQQYASQMTGFHVLPIYGGQAYDGQLRRLKRGVHVVVGTPGRVMDHMRRGTLSLKALSCLVLDEADEMLRMGFIDDVTWVLEQTPPERQITLFSATLPKAIRQIAQKYLNNPVEVTIKTRTATVEATRQRFWMVSGFHKLDTLTRILEAETFDGVLIFVRTKTATMELSEKLEARGYASAPLNGDITQSKRERTVEQFKKGKINILVATDVAARGLDVERISHVINYDIPYDTESYVHRIGRTGRAGRSGEAILFVAPREKYMLRSIERATKQKIELLELPSTEVINDKRVANFEQRITDTLAAGGLEFYYDLMEKYLQEHNVPAVEIAASLAKLVQGDEPLLLTNRPKNKKVVFEEFEDRPRKGKSFAKRGRASSVSEKGMERFRIEVGRNHGVNPGNIVGAIANEAQIDSKFIGRINIYDDFSTVDLPEGMSSDILRVLKKIWVSGQQLKISRLDERGKQQYAKDKSKFKPKHKKEQTGYSRKRNNK
ncbi:DEAD/DEAH box helicase [Candidatus Oleimmundimicrobium sp.]|uniref:DEAD/DEAH box helicase n=1 Tax=Candidatus Oleimmundimicrobium sp. TaxID=3060597 RepID=UPI00271E4BFD|nr:DEAD/DEAH box helicase [Candidatus Oleimmundimicrobium sp.]MDO8886762.1 DEAD/DEAH box helicase [Candidatus Oleimmundimicrobium sp.]